MIIDWKSITVEQWDRISRLGEVNEVQSTIGLIAILKGMSEDEVRNLPLSEASEMRRDVMEAIALLNENSGDEVPPLEEFKIGGTIFTFANLNEDWIFAKNIDLEATIKNGGKLSTILAILYYPKDIAYETRKALKWSEAIGNLPVWNLIPALNFFFLLASNSVKITGNYSLLQMMEEMTRVMTIGLKTPDQFLPTIEKLLRLKLRASGIPLEYSNSFQVEGLNNGSMSYT